MNTTAPPADTTTPIEPEHDDLGLAEKATEQPDEPGPDRSAVDPLDVAALLLQPLLQQALQDQRLQAFPRRDRIELASAFATIAQAQASRMQAYALTDLVNLAHHAMTGPPAAQSGLVVPR